MSLKDFENFQQQQEITASGIKLAIMDLSMYSYTIDIWALLVLANSFKSKTSIGTYIIDSLKTNPRPITTYQNSSVGRVQDNTSVIVISIPNGSNNTGNN